MLRYKRDLGWKHLSQKDFKFPSSSTFKSFLELCSFTHFEVAFYRDITNPSRRLILKCSSVFKEFLCVSFVVEICQSFFKAMY
jgi:hypothetical protein